MAQATIVAGHITDEAEQHLRAHGAGIERIAGLTIIDVPASAEIAPGPYTNQHAIAWNVEDRDEEGPYTREADEWIVVDLALDATETRVSLKKVAS